MNDSLNLNTKDPVIKERNLGREKAFGLCHSDGLIELDPRQDSKEFLNTCLHECLHHHFPDLTENQVIKISNSMTKSLWRLNFRRIIK